MKRTNKQTRKKNTVTLWQRLGRPTWCAMRIHDSTSLSFPGDLFLCMLNMFRDSYTNYNEEPCDRKWPSVTLSVPGGREANQNRQEKLSRNTTKLEKHGVIFNLAGSRLSGCKRSTMAEVSLAATRPQMLRTHVQHANRSGRVALAAIHCTV